MMETLIEVTLAWVHHTLYTKNPWDQIKRKKNNSNNNEDEQGGEAKKSSNKTDVAASGIDTASLKYDIDVLQLLLLLNIL